MPAAKDCHTLTSYYIKLYKAKYGSEPSVNRHTARWGFDSVLMGMTLSEARVLLDFYLTTNSSKKHALDWFFYNYEKLQESMVITQEDAARRAQLREESRIRAQEWRERGKQGITDNQRGTKE